jgi:hypothetical protein
LLIPATKRADTKGMKKLCLILALGLCPGIVMAETVMVSVGGQGLSGEPDAAYRFCFSALESGIMDVFFNAGHIIFNDDNFRTEEDQYRTVRLAREGGASAVLFVDCLYNPGDIKDKNTEDGAVVTLPNTIVLSYVRTSDFGVIKKERFEPSAKDAGDFGHIEDYYALLGRKAAESILAGR